MALFAEVLHSFKFWYRRRFLLAALLHWSSNQDLSPVLFMMVLLGINVAMVPSITIVSIDHADSGSASLNMLDQSVEDT